MYFPVCTVSVQMKLTHTETVTFTDIYIYMIQLFILHSNSIENYKYEKKMLKQNIYTFKQTNTSTYYFLINNEKHYLAFIACEKSIILCEDLLNNTVILALSRIIRLAV